MKESLCRNLTSNKKNKKGYKEVKMTFKKFLLVGIMFVVIFSFVNAEAQQIYGDIDWFSPIVNNYYGRYEMNVINTQGNSYLNTGTYQAWCVSQTQANNIEWYYNYTYSDHPWDSGVQTDVLSKGDFEKIAWLLDNYAWETKSSSGFTDWQYRWAGLQTAIWEGIVWTGFGSVGGTVGTYQNKYLTALNDDYSGYTPNDNFIYLQDHQDYMVVIPEPGTLLLLGSGFLGLGLVGWFRRKRS